MPASDLPARLERYLLDQSSGIFEDLALEAFKFQYERLDVLRTLCARRNITVDSVRAWQSIPAIPTAAFKTLELETVPALETFRSSGTGGTQSVHRHGFPTLYKAAIDASFPYFCLPLTGRGQVDILMLVAERAQAPDSSLSFMAEHVLKRWGTPESLVALGPRGVEVGKARSWLSAAQRRGQPVLIFATAFALLDLLDMLARFNLHFRLPAGSVIFETGGFKGKTREVTRKDLLHLTFDRLGVPSACVVREYGMSELTSQCYTRALAGGDGDLFVTPHWVRVQVLDPTTLAETPEGVPGLLSIFDLVNLSSAVRVLTEDLGVAEGNGFRLLGRAEGAELRGCSLAVEELR